MKAILFQQHGGPEVLQYTDFPTPEAKAGEVLVRLRAAALNRVDVTVRIGWPGLKLEYPHIPGCDGAGEVAALGEGATQFSVGDHVVINANLGCGKCDYCLAGEDNMCRNWHLLGETVRGTYAEYVSSRSDSFTSCLRTLIWLQQPARRWYIRRPGIRSSPAANCEREKPC